MNFFYIETMPDRPLEFDSEYQDPYEQRQPTYDELRQEENDALRDTLESIGRGIKVADHA